MIESLKLYNFLMALIYSALLAAWPIEDGWSGTARNRAL